MAKAGSGISFYEPLTRVEKHMELTKKPLKNIEKALVHYCSESGGVLLNRRAANHFADYLKQRLYSQEAMSGFPALSTSWKRQKEQMDLDARMGIATGAMAESIRALEVGSGKWKVGIHKDEPAPVHTWGLSGRGRGRKNAGIVRSRTLGSKKKIYQYAMIFEKGSPKQNQKPRPWFGVSFLKWIDQYAPQIYEPLAAAINPELIKLIKLWGGDVGPVDAKDLYRVYSGGAPPGVSDIGAAAEAFGYDPESGGASGMQIHTPDTAHTTYDVEPEEVEVDDLYDQVQSQEGWWEQSVGEMFYNDDFEKWMTDLDEIWDEYRKQWTTITNYMKEYR